MAAHSLPPAGKVYHNTVLRHPFARVLFLVLAGCGQLGASGPLTDAGRVADSGRVADPGRVADDGVFDRTTEGSATISHIVVIVQENRSVDNLFSGLTGADTVRSGRNSRGQTVRLEPEPLTAPYDVLHTHSAYETEYAHGRMDGFDRVASQCLQSHRHCPPPRIRAYGYVPHDEIQPYFDLAKSYAFADEMFETNQGPSFPAHQYLVSGTSAIGNGSPWRASENPRSPAPGRPVDATPPPVRSRSSSAPTAEKIPTPFRASTASALPDLIDKRELSWHYYQEKTGPGLWNGLDAIRHIW